MVASLLVSLLVSTSLWSLQAEAVPITSPVSGPLVCDQIAVNATKVFATMAVSATDCHAKCEFSGRCDMSKYLEAAQEGPNCFFFDSKRGKSPVMYLPGEKLCTRVQCKGKSPAFPSGGCSQHSLTGSVLVEIAKPLASPEQCMNLCKAKKKCTHALFRHVVGLNTGGMCRLFESDPEGDELEYYPNESACTKFECGQWESLASYTGNVEGSSEEECARQCKDNCDMFVFESQNKLCYLLNSTLIEEGAHVAYFPGDRLCSASVELPTPPIPEGSCPQIEIYGRLLPDSQTRVNSTAECMDLCNANENCTHAGFNIFVNGTGNCNLFRESYMEARAYFYAHESFCPRTNGTARPFPRLVEHGSVKCGMWPFYGTYLKNITVENELACQKSCKGECDAFLFDRRPEIKQKNCFHYNSKEWSGAELLYHHGNELCSTLFESEEVPQKPGSCPRRRAFGVFLDDAFSYQTTAANCLAKCNETPGCTHANYNPSKSCYLFKEDRTCGPEINVKVDGVVIEEPGPNDAPVSAEIQYASGESFCARTAEPLACPL